MNEIAIERAKQPKALYLLNFVSMWECFSYYGMRVLLVLYLTEELKLSDGSAFALYALYTTLVEFCGVAGGAVADRFLGERRAIALGGWTIAFGHLALALPFGEYSLFAGLGAIVGGTALFRTNIPALLGRFYGEEDPLREAGYTLYYAGMNIGGFLATLLCGIVAELYGWHAGFGLAALGMIAGNIALYAGRGLLTTGDGEEMNKAEKRGVALKELQGGAVLLALVPLAAFTLASYEVAFRYFPALFPLLLYYAYRSLRGCGSEEKSKLYTLFGYLLFLILFYACEEQIGSSLLLFSERHVARSTPFGELPAASLININPLTILLFGPLLTRVIGRVKRAPLEKIGAAFLLLSAAFALLFFSCSRAGEGGSVSILYAFIAIALISTGEILIGPTLFAAASKASPKGLSGLVMSFVTLAYSLANLLSGAISQIMAVHGEGSSMEPYMRGFFTLALLSGGVVAAIVGINLLNRKRKAVVAC